MRSAMLAVMLACIAWMGTSCSSGDTSENTDSESNSGSGFLAEGASEEDAMIKEGKGVGPIKDVTLGAIDPAMAEEGKTLFEAKCTACHKFSDEKYVGPGLKGVTKRRKPEWIMNMMLNPTVMTKQDPTAMDLLATHLTQMTNQNVGEDGARKILEYFRQMDAQ